MRTTLKTRLIILFTAIFFLSVGVVILLIWFNNIYERNVMVLALANRQRILIEQVTSAVAELETDRDDRQQHVEILEQAAHTFEQTFWALTNGGQISYLPDQLVDVPAAQVPDIQLSLHQAHHTWDIFRGYLNEITSVDPADPNLTPKIKAAVQLSPKLSREAETVVKQYQAATEQTDTLFWWIGVTLFVGLPILIGMSYQLSRNALLHPLNTLASIIERMGQGDLNTPVRVTGPREIEALSHSLEAMRTQLIVSQSELNTWTNQMESRVAQRVGELNAVFESSQEMVNEPNLEDLFISITDRVKRLTRSQEVKLCLVNENSNCKEVFIAASSGHLPNSTASPQPNVGRPNIKVINIDSAGSVEMPCHICSFPQNSQARRILITPLRVGQQVLGGLCAVRSQAEAFDPDEIRALTLLANSTAIAISNARLVETSRCQAEQAAALVERERLAASLHDDLAQTLGHLNFRINSFNELLQSAGFTEDAASQLDLIRTELHKAYAQVRTALADLQQPAISTDDLETVPLRAPQTLAEELETCLSNFQDFASIPVHLDVIDSAVLALPLNLRFQVLNIIREALNNARRHAQAQQVRIHIEQAVGGKEICFTIEDDGRGFNLDTIERGSHYGLSIMRARAERSGGRFKVDSVLGAGTKIRAYFPLLTGNG